MADDRLGNKSVTTVLERGPTYKHAANQIFYLEHANTQHVPMPDEIGALWGPIPLDYAPPHADRTCTVIQLRLVDRTEVNKHMLKAAENRITARILHSLSLGMSAVHVFVDGKMVVMAHTVGESTIGSVAELKGLRFRQRQKKIAWRAMIVKVKKYA